MKKPKSVALPVTYPLKKMWKTDSQRDGLHRSSCHHGPRGDTTSAHPSLPWTMSFNRMAHWPPNLVQPPLNAFPIDAWTTSSAFDNGTWQQFVRQLCETFQSFVRLKWMQHSHDADQGGRMSHISHTPHFHIICMEFTENKSHQNSKLWLNFGTGTQAFVDLEHWLFLLRNTLGLKHSQQCHIMCWPS